MVQRCRNPQNHHNSRHSHPDPTPRATAHGLGMSTTTNGENGNTALDDTEREGNDDTTERRRHHGRRGGGKPGKKKGPRDVNVSWATDKFLFFFSGFFFFSLTVFWVQMLTMGRREGPQRGRQPSTQHLPPLLRATARRVDSGCYEDEDAQTTGRQGRRQPPPPPPPPQHPEPQPRATARGVETGERRRRRDNDEDGTTTTTGQ